MKIYYKDEDDLSKLFCELIKCEGEQKTESDNTGCTGCDASEEWINKKYSEHTIDESNEKVFLSQFDVKQMIKDKLEENTLGMDFPIYRKDIVKIFEEMLKECSEIPTLDLKNDRRKTKEKSK